MSNYETIIQATPAHKHGNIIASIRGHILASQASQGNLSQTDLDPFLQAEVLYRLDSYDTISAATFESWEKVGLQALIMTTLMAAFAKEELIVLAKDRLKELVGSDERLRHVAEGAEEDVGKHVTMMAEHRSRKQQNMRKGAWGGGRPR
ncbi:hypothetical protein P7C70_g3827, partial [Phenoliferia sp. Uapishka_3]